MEDLVARGACFHMVERGSEENPFSSNKRNSSPGLEQAAVFPGISCWSNRERCTWSWESPLVLGRLSWEGRSAKVACKQGCQLYRYLCGSHSCPFIATHPKKPDPRGKERIPWVNPAPGAALTAFGTHLSTPRTSEQKGRGSAPPAGAGKGASGEWDMECQVHPDLPL